MKIYIAGKGNVKLNKAIAHIRALGHDAILPKRNKFVNFAISQKCDALYLLSDWKESENAIKALAYANVSGKIIFKQHNTGMSYFHDLFFYQEIL